MLYNIPPISSSPTVTVAPSSDISTKTSLDISANKTYILSKDVIANPTAPETLPPEFSTNNFKVIAQNTTANIPVHNSNTDPIPKSLNNSVAELIKQQAKPKSSQRLRDTLRTRESTNLTAPSKVPDTKTPDETASLGSENLLLGVIINKREVGTLDVVRRGKTLLLPLEDFAKLTGFTVETTDDITQLKTPLGAVKLSANEVQKINGIIYISDTLLQEKLAAKIEFNSLEVALIVGLPWIQGSREYSTTAADLQPEFLPPLSGISNFRQELNIVNSSNDLNIQSYTLLGGRLAGGSWRLRLNNNFENSPDIAEYFFYKRDGQLRYQLGRQQIGLHPLLNGQILTGAQLGYTNLPADRFTQNYNASELLPRRSRSVQTFSGIVPPTSFVQLRVGGIVIAQQQVGFSGEYEFVDVNLAVGQNNQIELLVYDRNNFSTPIEIRTIRINASDLLLPAGGNVQLAGLGISGNLAQDTLFDDYNYSEAGKFVGFYQFRQGLSENFTVESSLQAMPDTLQTQVGLVWRLANPVILSSSVGTSYDKLAYNTDLDIQLGALDISGNSQFFPDGYRNGRESGERFNHSLEVNYRFDNNLRLGFLTRSRKYESESTNYIAPTFYFRPFSSLYFNGRPDVEGRYLFNAFYQVNPLTRLSFNTFGDTYATDLTYKIYNNYQLSLGSDFGGDLPTRYLATINYLPRNIRGLSWKLGLAYRDGDVGPIVGASAQLVPGLFGRVEYQGIPSRAKNIFGGFGDDRLTISLVSDLSFAGGRVAPSNSASFGKERGAIAGRIILEGSKKNFDLSGMTVRIVDKRNQTIGGAITDSRGDFFVGNLPEGVYMVQFNPEKLPIEISMPKTTTVAEVASSAVTQMSVLVRVEYGLAGRVTNAVGEAISELQVELINADGKKVSSSVTDQFGLYRLDGIPVGKYTLQVPTQDGITNNVNLPTRNITIDSDFVYDQNLLLPISVASPKNKEVAPTSR